MIGSGNKEKQYCFIMFFWTLNDRISYNFFYLFKTNIQYPCDAGYDQGKPRVIGSKR